MSGAQESTAADWARAFVDAARTVSELGGAQIGDRTMVDALRPAADAFQAATARGEPTNAAWQAAVAAALSGRDATESMAPRLGRASYLGVRAIGIPDAGAAAVVVWMEALAPHIR